MKIKVNEAQHILVACGADPQTVLLGHHSQRSPNSRKKGPGRICRHKTNPAGAKIGRHAQNDRLGVRNPGGMVSVAFNEIRRQRAA